MQQQRKGQGRLRVNVDVRPLERKPVQIDLTGWFWTGLIERSLGPKESDMRRGQKTSAEQVVLKLRQIEVQTAQGKSLALACKEAEISEQSYYRWRKEYGGLQVDQPEDEGSGARERAAAAAGSRSILGEAGVGGRRLGNL